MFCATVVTEYLRIYIFKGLIPTAVLFKTHVIVMQLYVECRLEIMNSFRFKKLVLYGASITSAFLLGSLVEKSRSIKNEHNGKIVDIPQQLNCQIFSEKISCKPGLPLFGTVSAAVPAPAEHVNLTATPTRVSEIMRFGFPGMEHVRSYSDFVLSYDRRNRVPYWVFEHLTSESVAKNDMVDRSKCDFRPDESIHPFFRSENSDYRRSGFDRGHMAAAGNHKRHQKHCEDTFYLTNMAPQVGQGFNRDSWNRLESYVRKLTSVYHNVYVCTGPLYLPHKEDDGKMYVKYQVIGNNTVAVPTHFYKIIVGETADKGLEMESFVMPNRVISDDTPLEAFRVPPETIERAAGLLFFDRINRNQLSKINGKKM